MTTFGARAAHRLLAPFLMASLSSVMVLPPAGAAPAIAAGPTITIGGLASGGVRPGFVGLAFEASSLNSPIFTSPQSNLTGFLNELGPSNIRIGGTSSDTKTLWQPVPSIAMPPWVKVPVTPVELAGLASVATAAHWSVDLGLNLYHYDPTTAAAEAKGAQSILGSTLRNLEIGNEPELYYAYGKPNYTYAKYLWQHAAYVRAISTAAPGVRIAGPDTYTSLWFGTLTPEGVSGDTTFTQHFYPYYDCNDAPFSAQKLLSSDTFSIEHDFLTQANGLAHQLGLPMVLNEVNSISCGATAPVQYQFASALWVTRALAQAAALGAASINIQNVPGRCASYTPLCVPDPNAPAILQPNPLFAGLQMVKSLEGGRFLGTTSSGLPSDVGLRALVMSNSQIKVLVTNCSTTPINGLSLLRSPRLHVLSVERLSASSLTSTLYAPPVTTTPSTDAPTGLSVAPMSAAIFTLSQ